MSKVKDKHILSFPSQLYVGTETLMPFNISDPPLGFATPFGTDAAFEKRKETVDRWCGDGREYDYQTRSYILKGSTKPQVIDNTPLEGFAFDSAIERDRTSNKVFRITDPRGFQLEIGADNLADILLHSEIKKGVLQGPFIWGRSGGSNFLTRMDHPSYLHHVAPVISRTKLQPGDHIHLGSKTDELVFCGEFYVFKAIRQTIRTEYPERRTGGSFATRIYWGVQIVRDTKPQKVFRYLGNEEKAHRPYLLQKTANKFVILSEGNELPDDMPLNGTCSKIEYGSVSSFFQSKADLDAFQPTIEQVKAWIEEHDAWLGGGYEFIYVQPGVKTPSYT
jgi:hypothetical protein